MARWDTIALDAARVLFSGDMAEVIAYNGAEVFGHIAYANDAGTTAKHATLTVRTLDVPAPAYRDTVVHAGTTWRVHQDQSQESTIKGDGLTWELPLIRDERPRLF